MERLTASGRPSRAKNAHLPPGQNFDDKELALLLYAHGDLPPIRRISTKHNDIIPAIPETAKVLDELVSGFVVESCIQMSRSAALHGRKRIKVDDIQWAYRKNPEYLGKMEQMAEAKSTLDAMRKMTTAEEIAKDEAEALLASEPVGGEPVGGGGGGGDESSGDEEVVTAGGEKATPVKAKGVGPKKKATPAKKVSSTKKDGAKRASPTKKSGVKKAPAPRKRKR